MSNPLAKRVKEISKTIPEAKEWGKAQKLWNLQATQPEKCKLLMQKCGATSDVAHLLAEKPWDALPKWARMRLKKFFDSAGEQHELYPEAGRKKGKAQTA